MFTCLPTIVVVRRTYVVRLFFHRPCSTHFSCRVLYIFYVVAAHSQQFILVLLDLSIVVLLLLLLLLLLVSFESRDYRCYVLLLLLVLQLLCCCWPAIDYCPDPRTHFALFTLPLALIASFTAVLTSCCIVHTHFMLLPFIYSLNRLHLVLDWCSPPSRVHSH